MAAVKSERAGPEGQSESGVGSAAPTEIGSTNDREERIRRLAYRLWEQAGEPDDHTDEYWYQAEAEISGSDSSDDSTGAL